MFYFFFYSFYFIHLRFNKNIKILQQNSSFFIIKQLIHSNTIMSTNKYLTCKKKWFADSESYNDPEIKKNENVIYVPNSKLSRETKYVQGKKKITKGNKKIRFIFVDEGSDYFISVNDRKQQKEIVDNKPASNRTSDAKDSNYRSRNRSTTSKTNDILNYRIRSFRSRDQKIDEREEKRLLLHEEVANNWLVSDYSMIAVVINGYIGIGLEIVKNLCQKFLGTVYLTAKEIKQGFDALATLRVLGFRPSFFQMDVADEQSVRSFAEHLSKQFLGVNILVNNFTMNFEKRSQEEEVLRAVTAINVNYFGVVNVCDALFPLIREHARIVHVTSSAGHLTNIPDADLRQKLSSPKLTKYELNACMKDYLEAVKRGDDAQQGWPNDPNIVSKVGVGALTRIQHRSSLADSREGIIVNHVHPGYIDKRGGMYEQYAPLPLKIAADAPTYLALLPKGADYPRGEFVWFTREVIDWIHGSLPPTMFIFNPKDFEY